MGAVSQTLQPLSWPPMHELMACVAISGAFAPFPLCANSSRVRVVPPRAIAVTGATGCGKSLLCHHLSTILGVPSLHPTLSDIVRGEVGESERRIHALFQEARALSPCVIVLDDLAPVFARSTQAAAPASSGVCFFVCLFVRECGCVGVSVWV